MDLMETREDTKDGEQYGREILSGKVEATEYVQSGEEKAGEEQDNTLQIPEGLPHRIEQMLVIISIQQLVLVFYI